MKTTRICLVALSLAVVAVAGCSDAYRSDSGVVWGTTYTVTYKSPEPMSDSLTAVMRRVERSLSMFDRGSLVSAINARLTDSVDAYIGSVLGVAADVHEMSGGMFDPTVAPLVNLWGFGISDSVPEPDSLTIVAALDAVGFDKIVFDNTHIFMPPGMALDFSAIAKGFGVDCCAEMLERNGCSDFMVEIGGEIVLRGQSPRGTPWRVQIDAPVATDSAAVVHERLTVIEPQGDCAIATSGNYRNWRYDSDGERIGHTISPLTGRPVQTDVLSATVIAPRCVLADAMATACMAMPSADALDMIERQPAVSALLVVVDSVTAKPLVITTSRWPVKKETGCLTTAEYLK